MFTDIRKHYSFSPDEVVLVTVTESAGQVCRLACFEPRQTLSADAVGVAALYVLEGTGIVTMGEKQEYVSAGSLVAADPFLPVAATNPGPGRLVMLLISCKQ